jgi:hypothetical protein
MGYCGRPPSTPGNGTEASASPALSPSFLLVEGGLLVCVAELCGVTTAVNLKGTDSLHSQVTVTVAPEVLCCPMAPMHKYIYVVNIK